MISTERRRATALMAAVAWHGEAPDVDDEILTAALRAAVRNQVQGVLARAYPERLAGLLHEVERATAAFEANLTAATARLVDAGVRPVLIKADPGSDYVYTNFDLVVGEKCEAARRALAGWYVRTSNHPLEPDKVLLHPASGPAAHLHTAVSWFGVPVIPADRLAVRAAPRPGGWAVPCPADELRIWLAHAVFQNLALDLSELLSIRTLLRPEVIAEAERGARHEGWRRAFIASLRTAREAANRLDHHRPVSLPVPLGPSASLAVGEHVRYLRSTGRPAAARREAALRGPLATVKRFRLALA